MSIHSDVTKLCLSQRHSQPRAACSTINLKTHCGAVTAVCYGLWVVTNSYSFVFSQILLSIMGYKISFPHDILFVVVYELHVVRDIMNFLEIREYGWQSKKVHDFIKSLFHLTSKGKFHYLKFAMTEALIQLHSLCTRYVKRNKFTSRPWRIPENKFNGDAPY